MPGRNHTSDMAAEPASGGTQPLPFDGIDDADLLRRAGHGEGGAFQELVNRHGRYLHGVARSLAGNRPDDADDLVQETFVAVLGAARKFRGEASVRTWMVSILVRQSALQRRKHRRFPRLSQDGAVTEGPLVKASPFADAAVDAKLDLAKMLESLSIEHRQIIVLRELQQMSYEQMATVLDVPRGTVESRLSRAREELRKKFKEYG